MEGTVVSSYFRHWSNATSETPDCNQTYIYKVVSVQKGNKKIYLSGLSFVRYKGNQVYFDINQRTHPALRCIQHTTELQSVVVSDLYLPIIEHVREVHAAILKVNRLCQWKMHDLQCLLALLMMLYQANTSFHLFLWFGCACRKPKCQLKSGNFLQTMTCMWNND